MSCARCGRQLHAGAKYCSKGCYHAARVGTRLGPRRSAQCRNGHQGPFITNYMGNRECVICRKLRVGRYLWRKDDLARSRP